MGYFAVLIVCIALSALSLWKLNGLLSFVAGLSWIAMLAYSRVNPPGGIAPGSSADELLVVIFWGSAGAMLLSYFLRSRDNRRRNETANSASENGETSEVSEMRQNRVNTHGWGERDHEQSYEEYRAALHARLHQNKRKQ